MAPRYAQIQCDLAAQIASGGLRPGDPVPSELALSARYRVSRMTARQALRNLELDGQIVRIRGSGSFVAPPRLEKTVTGLVGFSEEMRRRGLVPSSVVVKAGRVPAGPNAAAALGLSAGAEVWQLTRLRLADSQPMALEETYLAVSLSDYDFETGSLYTYLEQRYGIVPSLAREEVSAIVASREQAHLLCIKAGAPLLEVRRSVYTDQREPVEYVRSLYRADRYVLEIVRHRKLASHRGSY